MKDKGYTLIEIMVSVAILFTLIAAPTGFFVSAIRGQQKALSSQKLLDSASYVLEYINRSLRMAKKDLTGECIAQNTNYETTRGGRGVKFLNYQDVCQEFFWDTDDNRLKESKKKGGVLSLTPNDSAVISFKIGPAYGWGQDDDKQPKITLFLEIKGNKFAVKPELQPEIKIQTTISQRNLDVAY